MTEEQQTLMAFKSMIYDMPGDKQDIVREYTRKFESLLGENELAVVAFGLVGATMAAEPDKD